MTADVSDDFDMAEWVAESRAKQGLPPTVTDPAVLAAVTAALRPGRRLHAA